MSIGAGCEVPIDQFSADRRKRDANGRGSVPPIEHLKAEDLAPGAMLCMVKDESSVDW